MYEGGISRCLDARTHLQDRRRAPNSTRAKRDYWNYIISRLLLGYIEYVIRAIRLSQAVPGDMGSPFSNHISK